MWTAPSFFVDKVNVPYPQQHLALRTSTVRLHSGLELSAFLHPVIENEDRRLLSTDTMPSKSSPLDVLPCTLLEGCADVFAVRTGHSQTVCISVPLWQIRIFGFFFHAKSGYPDLSGFLCAGSVYRLSAPVIGLLL